MNTETITTQPKSPAQIENELWVSIKGRDKHFGVWCMALCRWHFQMTKNRLYGVELSTLLKKTHPDFVAMLEGEEKGLIKWANESCLHTLEDFYRSIPPTAKDIDALTMIDVSSNWFEKLAEIEGFIPELMQWYFATSKPQIEAIATRSKRFNKNHGGKYGVNPNSLEIIDFKD